MSDDYFARLSMVDVYDDEDGGPLGAVPLYLHNDDGYHSLIIDDHPRIDGGSFNVVIENQRGVPYLHLWTRKEMGNDPLYTINLHTGEKV